MDERPTLVGPTRAIALAVGCNGSLLARCREIADKLHLDIEPVELLALAPAAAYLRPVVLIIAADVYGFDPAEFDALAMTVGAARVLVELGEPPERLDARLCEALEDTMSSRARAAAGTKQGEERRRSSGIRLIGHRARQTA